MMRLPVSTGAGVRVEPRAIKWNWKGARLVQCTTPRLELAMMLLASCVAGWIPCDGFRVRLAAFSA